MKIRILSVACLMLSLSACGTRPFTPSEYPLDADAIPQFDVNGQVTISNGQPDTNPVIVYSYGGSKLSSNLHDITSLMTSQAVEELHRHQHATGSGAAKTIELKVDSELSEYSIFHWNSHLHFEAKLGDGEVVQLTVEHSSGSLAQDLNGCVADSVAALFHDPKVLAYLAK